MGSTQPEQEVASMNSPSVTELLAEVKGLKIELAASKLREQNLTKNFKPYRTAMQEAQARESQEKRRRHVCEASLKKMTKEKEDAEAKLANLIASTTDDANNEKVSDLEARLVKSGEDSLKHQNAAAEAKRRYAFLEVNKKNLDMRYKSLYDSQMAMHDTYTARRMELLVKMKNLEEQLAIKESKHKSLVIQLREAEEEAKRKQSEMQHQLDSREAELGEIVQQIATQLEAMTSNSTVPDDHKPVRNTFPPEVEGLAIAANDTNMRMAMAHASDFAWLGMLGTTLATLLFLIISCLVMGLVSDMGGELCAIRRQESMMPGVFSMRAGGPMNFRRLVKGLRAAWFVVGGKI